MSDSRSSSGGLSLGSVLFLIFLTLKLTGHITWSWWWVTSPLWTSALFLVVFVSVLVVFKRRIRKRRARKRIEFLEKHGLHVMLDAERRVREREEQGR